MSLKNLKYNYFKGDTFFIRKRQKIEGMQYAVVKIDKLQLNGIVECVDLTAAAYPLPRNLRERLEKMLLPRLYEIKNELDADTTLPDSLGIEISKLNQEDIIYGLKSSSIQKLLRKRGYKPENLKRIIKNIQFIKFKN